jgi:phosphatidylinositol phospholipase C, delta
MQMANKIFGEMLYCPTTDCITEFPSPASLKNMVLISTKPPKEHPQTDGANNHVSNGSESSEDETWGQEQQDSMAKLKTEDMVRNRKSYIHHFTFQKRKRNLNHLFYGRK